MQQDGDYQGFHSDGWLPCNYTHRPCDYCSCKKVDGKKAELLIEEDGCQKPKRCPKLCPSHKETRVGDKYDCWIDDYK